MNLLDHPYLKATDPTQSRLVRLSLPFPDWLNPFAKDGVAIRAAAIPGEVQHSKSYMARELILGGIRDHKITQDTIVVESSSGNTGQAIGQICKALGLRCRLIVPGGLVGGKLGALRVIGSGVEVIPHTNPDESPVEHARREGKLPGHYNPDQYGNPLNPLAHRNYLAQQLFVNGGRISLVAVASGTMGTAMGIMQYANDHELPTMVLPVILAEGHEVPGMRPLSKINKDIRLPWHEFFAFNVEFATRHTSFLLAYYSWQWVPQMLGPSFGAAFQGALRKLHKLKQSGRLDNFRLLNGIVEVVILGADSYALYPDLILGETKSDERHSNKKPDLLELAFKED